MAANGKAKGSEFERIICKKLSLWISEGKRNDLYWRSAMSGGRATVQSKKGIVNKSQVCDISSIDPLGNKLTDAFLLECKSYRNIHIDSLIYGRPKNNSLLEFWVEVAKKGSEYDKAPLIIFKENGKPIIIGCNYYFGEEVIGCNEVTELAYFDEYDLRLYFLDDVLNEVDPAILDLLPERE
jgi:hypothetical protein